MHCRPFRSSHERAQRSTRVPSLALGITALVTALGCIAILVPTSQGVSSPVVAATDFRVAREADSTAVTIEHAGTEPARVDVARARSVGPTVRRFARISGIVVNDTGVPIEGAAVIWIEESWQCETAADGRFVIDPFSDLSPLQGHMIAAHPEHGRSAPTSIGDSGELRLVLDRAAEPRLCGRVESASGAPVVGCYVEVARCSESEPPIDSPARYGAESGTIVTDARGEFCFAGLIDDPAGYSIRVAPELEGLRADGVRLGSAPVILRVDERVLVACRVVDATGAKLQGARLTVAAYDRSVADRVARDPRDRALALLDEPIRTPIETTQHDDAPFLFWAEPATLVTLHARASAGDVHLEDAVEAVWIHAGPARIDTTIRVAPIAAQQGVRLLLDLPVAVFAPTLRCTVTADDADLGERESRRAISFTRTAGDGTFVGDLVSLRVGTHRLRLDFEDTVDVPTLAPLESEVTVTECRISDLELRARLGARIEVTVEQPTRFTLTRGHAPDVRTRMLVLVECDVQPTRIRGAFDVIRPDDSGGFHALYATDIVVPLDRASRVQIMSLRGDAATLDLDGVRIDANQHLRLHLTLGLSGEPIALRVAS